MFYHERKLSKIKAVKFISKCANLNYKTNVLYNLLLKTPIKILKIKMGDQNFHSFSLFHLLSLSLINMCN